MVDARSCYRLSTIDYRLAYAPAIALATVLVVDDEKNIRRTLRMVLESEDYRVLEAGSAEEGLKLLEEDSVDCMLLDLKLPGMSGLDALARLHGEGQGPQLPVIVVSGHGTVSDAVQATRLGAFDFLEKPPSTEKTILVIKNAIKQRSLEAEVRSLRERMNVRHTMIGDYVPADLARYGMQRGQIIRVDCAAYGVLGLAKSGG